jgi:uncharacterized membrane protein YeaQ/YmgE (transglycosylase-associated protein family)
MSFAMFVTWVLVGLLAGVLGSLLMKRGGYGLKTDAILGVVGSLGASWIFRGLVSSQGGMLTGVVAACIGAAIPIIVQRTMWPTDRLGQDKGAMWKWGFGAALVAAMLWMNLGPAQQPAATAAVIEDKSYPVTPATLPVQAGIVTGEVVDMKVTERVEKGSDRIVSLAKLSGILRLKNASPDQTVRLVAGTLQYLDANGQPIELEDARTAPTISFTPSSTDRLDPGQETTHALDLDFPAEALQAARLTGIRLELTYTTSPFRQETVNLPVSIGGR